jgi:hypothetical protein
MDVSGQLHSSAALPLKILIYKTIIIPIWAYGLELWGCSSKSNIAIIQRSQSKIHRMIVDAPRYVSNATLHTDLGILSVPDVIKQKTPDTTPKSKPMKIHS